jgi:hypothetical protein
MGYDPLTGPDGSLAVGPLPPGGYRVRALIGGQVAAEAAVRIASVERVKISLVAVR